MNEERCVLVVDFEHDVACGQPAVQIYRGKYPLCKDHRRGEEPKKS